MSFLDTILLVSLVGISIFDFYQLNKFKIKISKCILNSILTLLLSVLLAGILAAILSMMFKDNENIDFFYSLGVIIVLILNYFRFIGRRNIRGKIEQDEKGIFTYFLISIFSLWCILCVFWVSYMSITTSLNIWGQDLSYIKFGNYGLGGTALLSINNLLISIFGSLANEIASIFLFWMGLFGFAIFGICIYLLLSEILFKKSKLFKKLNLFKKKK